MCAGADADKRKNWDYYEAMLKLVRPGGLILIDNVLFYGRVADPEVRHDSTSNRRRLLIRLIQLQLLPLMLV